MFKHNLSIRVLGLWFEAEVNVWPALPGSQWEPPETESLEVVSLKHDGADASFLLCSTADEDIEMACWDALAEIGKEEP